MLKNIKISVVFIILAISLCYKGINTSNFTIAKNNIRNSIDYQKKIIYQSNNFNMADKNTDSNEIDLIGNPHIQYYIFAIIIFLIVLYTFFNRERKISRKFRIISG